MSRGSPIRPRERNNANQQPYGEPPKLIDMRTHRVACNHFVPGRLEAECSHLRREEAKNFQIRQAKKFRVAETYPGQMALTLSDNVYKEFSVC